MKTALITGASSGIGKEFAKIFAEKNYNLVLASRGEEKLKKVSIELKQKYKIKVEYFTLDLSQQNSAQILFDKIQKRKIVIDVLINNAGFGKYGDFIETNIEEYLTMIQLNISTLTELTSLFAIEMLKRKSGKILNVASTAAFQPLPKFATYAASKSYVLHFSEALHFELRNSGINVSVLCPGPTETSFEHTANAKNSNLFKGKLMKPQDVARIGYKGLMKNKMTIIPGFKNKFLAFLATVFPSRKMLVYITSKMS